MVISIPASAGEIDISWAIWTVCIGVCLAIIYSYLDKLISGKIVSQLIILGLGEEKGKTLAELGFSGFFFKLYCVLLKDNMPLRRIISVVGGQIPQSCDELDHLESDKGSEPLYYDDFSKAQFYIEESKLDKAKAMYGKPPKWYFLPVFIALTIGVAYGCTLIAPWVMGLIG
jgi:hypothetical protein